MMVVFFVSPFFVSSCSFLKGPPPNTRSRVFPLKPAAPYRLKTKKKNQNSKRQARSAPSCSTRRTGCSPRPGSRSSSPRSGRRFPGRELLRLCRRRRLCRLRRRRRRRRRARSCSACWSRRLCPPRSPGWPRRGSGRALPPSAKRAGEEGVHPPSLLLDARRPTLLSLLSLLPLLLLLAAASPRS